MPKPIEFQIISWHAEDEIIEDEYYGETDSSSDEDKSKWEKKTDKSKYVISIFGKDHKNKTYVAKITGFKPYFYVKIPDYCDKSHKVALENWLRAEMSDYHQENFLRTSLRKCHSFRNFDNKKRYNFVRFVFKTKKAMRHAVYKFQKRVCSYCKKDKILDREKQTRRYNSYCRCEEANRKTTDKLVPADITIPAVSPHSIVYPLYENMIDPLLKFIHHKDLETVGWVKIKDYTEIHNTTTCDQCITCDWKDIKKISDKGNTKLKIVAFDIECDSSHGDFPLPIKDYTKFAREIYNSYYKLAKSRSPIIDNKLKFIKKCLRAGFKDGDESLEISKIYIKKNPGNYISKYNLDIIANEAKEYLYMLNSKNSIELKQHNTRCIENINRVMSGTKTAEEVFEVIKREIENKNEDAEHGEGKKYKKFTNWTYKDITGHFPPKEDKNIPRNDLKKLINYYDEIDTIYDELNPKLPEIKGDKTIQIGLSFINYGEKLPYKNYMLTLKNCEVLSDAVTECFRKEGELLLRFTEIIQSENPDIITGWNTDGFDVPWLFKRAEELDISENFSKMSKFKNHSTSLKNKQKKGHTGELIVVEYVELIGRIQLDLLPLVRTTHNLGSYKLDNVAATFINGAITSYKYDRDTDLTSIHTKSTTGLNNENFIMINILDGYLDNKYEDGRKFEISNINKITNTFCIKGEITLDLDKKCNWCLGKDDVSPKDIFRLQNGDDHDRYIIAKYCMMDVILCIELLNKLELLTNNMGMDNVCKNPLSWIINRGQGIKILSLVAFFLRNKNYLIPYLYKDTFDKEGYEGAVVLDPNPGIYINRPIAVLDYASLYPSSMIEVNLSHETLVSNPLYLGDKGGRLLNEMGYDYEDITYDRYKTIYTPAGSVKSKLKVGEKIVRYVQYRDGTKGLIPQILKHLLFARKNTRKKIKYKTITTKNKTYTGLYNEEDKTVVLDGVKTNVVEEIISITDTYTEFEKKVLDGLQAAFKVTANSLYGQMGAKTSDIYYKEIAASTTAVGRDRLLIAKDFAIDSSNYPHVLDNGETIYLKNKLTYGDTDSIFVEFQCLDGRGQALKGREARQKSIELAIYTEKKIQKTKLKAPQVLEYEKTFDPFILLSKKRYVGDLYEMDPDKCKRKSMGIVLKRRDNAPIVKVIYGGIIDIIMKGKNIRPAITYLRKSLRELVKGVYGMNTLIITKTLSSYYKDPERIAHKVLADRIGDRDPGNKPKVNDRIPFVYIEVPKSVKLQGDRIENPKYIRDNNLKPDYEFYITNQLMKPISQIFALCLEDLPGFTKNISEFDNKYKVYLDKGKSKNDSIKYMLECKRKEAAKILFRDILRILENKRERNIEITKYFRVT